MVTDVQQIAIPHRSQRRRLIVILFVLVLVASSGALAWWLNQTHPEAAKFSLPLVSGAALGVFLTEATTKCKKLLNKSNPYIAVVASKRSIDFPIPGEFLRGFDKAFSFSKSYIETRDGKKVDVVIKEDLGSKEEAARIASELAADKECVLVIGNSNSTLTDLTLDIFVRSKNPPAYILPIATANEIMTKAKTANHGAVLRMVPDNSSQAEVIQSLVKDLAPEQRVAIYGDQENSFYSISLSRDIASRIRSNGGTILIEEMIGPTNSVYTSLTPWREANPPGVIVFVGVAHHGLLLIDQCQELGITVPIIFTDGCMVGSLLTNVSKIPNRAFVLSPVGGQRLNDQMPTYETIGMDAYNLASRVLSGCCDCTRAGVRKYVTEQKQAIHLLDGSAGEYRFDADGNNSAMTYRVYEITGGNLKRVIGH